MKANYKIFGVALVCLIAFSCKKSYLETKPSTSITDENLYKTATGCRTVLDGMARTMNTGGGSFTLDGASSDPDDWGQKTIDLFSDVMGADVVCYGGGYDWYFTDAYKWIGPSTTGGRTSARAWYTYYKLINDANLILANIDQAAALGEDPDQLNEIKAEAYAYRGWCYYRLSVYYCQTYSKGSPDNAKGVPVYTQPVTASSYGAPRGTLTETYNRIQTDLDSAEVLMSNSGVATPYGGNKSYVSLPTLYGMRAQVALVMNDWVNAEKYSDMAITEVGGAGSLMDATAYKAGFNSAQNSEWMWASQESSTDLQSMNIESFMSFVDKAAPGYCNYICTRKIPAYLLNIMPAGDVRKTTFDNSRNQNKFHLANPSVWDCDYLYMRLAEMFLIKAEAQAEQNKDVDATTTLETLVQKRNPTYSFATPYYTALPANQKVPGTKAILEEIYCQRRLELWLEGFSFSDLKRLQRGVHRPSTGSTNFNQATCNVLDVEPSNNSWLFRLSQREMDNNKSLTAADQNP